MQKAHSSYAVGFVFGIFMNESTKKKTRSFTLRVSAFGCL